MGIGCILVLVLLIIGVLYGVIAGHDNFGGFCFLILFFYLIVFLVSLGIDSDKMKPDGYYKNYDVSYTHYLKTAKLDKDLNGKMVGALFFIDGFVKTETNYKFYEDLGNHHYKLKVVDIATTTVVESKGKPKVVDYYHRKGWIKHGKIWRFFKGGPEIEDKTVNDYYATELYIPEGTIIDDYNKLNL